MNPEDQQRAREILRRALRFSGEEREVRVLEECAGDKELIVAVRALLEEEEQATLTGDGHDIRHDIQPGSRIGPGRGYENWAI